jgi:hypothetical protein
MTEWLLLAATLPTHPSALRVRVWRALKATGAGSLREGVYLLPASAPTAAALWDIAKTAQDGGAAAHMLVVHARDAAQETEFQSLFDRRDSYNELLQSIKETRARMKKSTEAELHKSLRVLDQQLLVVRTQDFFPGKASERAVAALEALRREVERHLSPGEPTSSKEGLQRRSPDDFQGKNWATRKRPWVDRLATAWLITRFIDRAPRFVWIDSARKCPKNAIGYDFDGARFTHVDDKVTYEVVLHTFGLERDAALKRIGDLVHYIDVGGIPVDAAAGVEALIRGLQAQHRDDDRLLAAALPVFDSLYAAMQVAE